MRRMGWVVAAVLGGCILSLPAVAQESEGPPSDVLRWALEDVENADDVFRIDGDHLFHIQTGMTCPAYVENAFLSKAMVFDSSEGTGTDVACDYARRAEPGKTAVAAKHTLYAVKLPAGATLEEYFEAYSESMHRTAPEDARDGGASLTFDEPIEGFPKFLSQELFFSGGGGRERQTELVLAEIDGWLVKIRSTKTSQYAIATRDEALDQTVGTILFFRAIGDLGGLKQVPEFKFDPLVPTEPTDTPARL